MKFWKLAVVIIVFSMASNASSAIITFDDNTDYIVSETHPIISGGFEISLEPSSADFSNSSTTRVISGGTGCGPECVYNGTRYLYHLHSSITDAVGGVIFTPVSGEVFSLISFDGAELHLDRDAETATSIFVVGNQVNGNVVTTEFILDWVNDGPGPLDDFQNFNLPDTFTNLTSVMFDGVGSAIEPQSGWFGMDNVEVSMASPVPVPTAVWLFSSGLIVLIGFARKKA